MVVAPTHEGSRRALIADLSVVLSPVTSSDIMDAAYSSSGGLNLGIKPLERRSR